ncbi:hypothetical protein Dform_00122 [Dehalogenimonas formicexedens]|uniref:Uncharacterized protein n=1 Tax=Dehalogenimonas formicexedens TaxID=1839801 RepID=A0A1P8F4W1_9CHLR|nr:hypothetical protein Dform_00122 [Dehalogenimonas formicexedens]
MGLLDPKLTEQVLERSGGKCECTDPEHEHGDSCGMSLDASCQYVYDPEVPLQLKVICHSCYRKRKAFRKKQY